LQSLAAPWLKEYFNVKSLPVFFFFFSSSSRMARNKVPYSVRGSRASAGIKEARDRHFSLFSKATLAEPICYYLASKRTTREYDSPTTSTAFSFFPLFCATGVTRDGTLTEESLEHVVKSGELAAFSPPPFPARTDSQMASLPSCYTTICPAVSPFFFLSLKLHARSEWTKRSFQESHRGSEIPPPPQKETAFGHKLACGCERNCRRPEGLELRPPPPPFFFATCGGEGTVEVSLSRTVLTYGTQSRQKDRYLHPQSLLFFSSGD